MKRNSLLLSFLSLVFIAGMSAGCSKSDDESSGATGSTGTNYQEETSSGSSSGTDTGSGAGAADSPKSDSSGDSYSK